VDPPVPLPMTPADRAALKRRQDKVVKDNICFSTLIKALIKKLTGVITIVKSDVKPPCKLLAPPCFCIPTNTYTTTTVS
jgi:hypothetical protein